MDKQTKEALENIRELCKPGQQINVTEAINIICDVWRIARCELNQARRRELS